MISVNYLNIIGVNKIKKFSSARGGEYHSECPFCGGEDRFVIFPNSDVPFAWCRQCDFSGGPVKFMMKKNNMSYDKANSELGIIPVRRQYRYSSKNVTKNGERDTLSDTHKGWQSEINRFIKFACEQIWQRQDALSYLRSRGIADHVINEAKLGYNPIKVCGMLEGATPLTYHAGITIPRINNNQINAVEVRLNDSNKYKYLSVRGGRSIIYGLDQINYNDIVIIVESALDALMLRSRSLASGLNHIAAIAVPANGKIYQPDKIKENAKHIIVCFDSDKPGQDCAKKWINVLGQNVTNIIPSLKDPGEMYKSGLDVLGWINNNTPVRF